MTSNRTTCTTVSGRKSNKACIFPFKFDGVTFKSCIMSRSRSQTKAWCSTKVDESGDHISGHSGFCEPACQPTKSPTYTSNPLAAHPGPEGARGSLTYTNEESKEVGKDSSTISFVVISITILILSSIIMIYYCYVKRNREGGGPKSKYINFNYLFLNLNVL